VNAKGLVESALFFAAVPVAFLVIWFALQTFLGAVPPEGLLPYHVMGATPQEALLKSLALLSAIVGAGAVVAWKWRGEGRSPNPAVAGLAQAAVVRPAKLGLFDEHGDDEEEGVLSGTGAVGRAVENPNVAAKTLDSALAELILRAINSLDVVPEISLEHEGDFEVLGKKWKGKVAITIKKREPSEASDVDNLATAGLSEGQAPKATKVKEKVPVPEVEEPAF
jgi:hypothetical protein